MNNLTTLDYIGNVKVSIKIKDKIYEIKEHNKGLVALGRAFCLGITGNPLTQEDIPQFLDIRKKAADSETYTTCLIQKVPLSGKTYVYDTELQNYVAKFTATIRYDYLTTPITRYDTESYRLYLVSGSREVDGKVFGNYDMAYLQSSKDTLSYLSPGTQAIVEWTLQIVDRNDETA